MLPAKILLAPCILMLVKAIGIDLGDPDVIFFVRILYGIAQFSAMLTMIYIYIRAGNETEKGYVTVEEVPGLWEQAQQKQLEGKGAKKAVVIPEKRKITIGEYDQEQLMKLAKTTLIGLCITGVLHLKFGFVQPLLILSILTPFTLGSNPLFLIHIMGKTHKKEGDNLKRPFKEDKPGDMFKNFLPKEMQSKPLIGKKQKTRAQKDALAEARKKAKGKR